MSILWFYLVITQKMMNMIQDRNENFYFFLKKLLKNVTNIVKHIFVLYNIVGV